MLRAEIGIALAESGNLRDSLQHCAESIVRNLDAAFARIWTVNRADNVLELRASAGLYTHLDGPHSRVPVGHLKIGKIAEERRPHLTNDVLHDPRLSDPEWARREGMVAFAGFPLMVDNRMVGVAALFARHPLAGDTLDALASVADILAQGIERRRAEEALRQRAAELAEAHRRKDEFLAMLSHELRNPLTPIGNALHLMRLRGVNDPLMQQARDIIERQVRHMARLIDDLLDVTRAAQGKIQLRLERVDLAGAVGRAVETVRPLIEKKNHRLTMALPPEPLVLQVDPVRLEQILVNLLTNAAKYTDPEGRIELTAAREDQAAVIRVRDSGAGITPEMRARIFDLFAQAEQTLDRSQGGLGIGLTLVRHLVGLHGGSIQVASEGPGRGSEFCLRLPALASENASHPGTDTARAPSPGPVSSVRRVLVVDDNRDGAESLAMLLRLWGHEVRVAYDGPSALRLAEAERPEVVLLDIGLPGMDGYQVARRLRERSGGARQLLVALTGYGQGEDRRRSQQAGFDHHLVKPLDPDELQRLLTARAAG
jgi:signal transduction histidine kinase